MSLALAKGFDWEEPASDSTALSFFEGRGGVGKCVAVNAAASQVTYTYSAFSGEAFLTVWLYYNSAPASGTSSMISLGGPQADHVNLATTNSRNLILRNGTTNRATSATTIPLQTWTRIDVALNVTSNTTGTCKVYQDGELTIDFSGDVTVATSVFTHSQVTLFSQTSNSYRFDDLVVCSSSGPVNNTFIGTDVRVLGLLANGAGDSTEWESVTSGVANWENVASTNEAFNYSRSGAGDLDRYAVADLDSQYTNIKGVIATALARSDGSTSTRTIKTSVKSGSTVSESAASAALPITNSAWASVNHVMETDPATSAAWTRAAVNALLAGAETL